MSNIDQITSRRNQHVRAVQLLRRRRGREQTGLFVGEGMREIDRALRSGMVIRQLFTCPQVLGSVVIDGWPSGLADRPREQVELFEVNESVLSKLAYRENPEGVVAVFEQRRWDMAQVISPDAAGADLWLVSVGATKPGNVGAMARTAAAAGAQGLLLADAVVDIYNPNAIHASTGAVFSLPVIGAGSEAILAALVQRDVFLVAADPGAEVRHTQVNLTGPTALIIGGEDKGLNDSWRAAASQGHGKLVSIAMVDCSVDSLNAASAAAVLLYEAVRQRQSVDTPENGFHTG